MSRIDEIEADLAVRGISVARLFREADMAQTSWARWKNGTVPTKRGWQRVLAAYEKLIGEKDVERAA